LSKRGNSEGSLYQSSDGWRGYVWCIRPDGTRYRKYVRGKTYDEGKYSEVLWAGMLTGGVGSLVAVTPLS
jgi:hypothetical protein